jgi:hypothetical protein
MRPDERVASEFLTKRFNQEPRYEPLGKSTPPDFSIDDTAFEVRRLNQRFVREDGSNEGLEELEIPLNRAVYSELSKTPFSEQGGTIFWGLKFKRPVTGELRKIVNQLGAAARKYYLEGSRKPREISEGGVTLHLFGASRPLGKAFRMGYGSDGDSGGMFGDIYPTSIRLALENKISKTDNIANQFDRWVLILVDEILPGMMEPLDEIGVLDLNLGHFNSVVVINSINGDLQLEYPASSLKLREQIRWRAYELFERRGREHGHDLEDWLKAEAEPIR